MEADALLSLANSLDGAFDEAVDILAGASGRVIVCGMGKSGHVAVKIASTLASTGTPAHFVHPGEAAHGDLGMIARDDVLLALSNSGGTVELAAVIAHAARYSVPLIAVTANADSPLAEGQRLGCTLHRAGAQ
ncbi:MAG: SIS domain-containing protein, partial [Alphaproteobacteria bacterium]|nr:SIS domain-containing protein [Alphaproteobacteria bacterium]